MWYWCKDLNKYKTIVKVRGSTNSISNKYNINSFYYSTRVVFVSRKLVSGKPLSKLSCICLPLKKLVNGKHFPVKGKFGLVSRKVFSFYFGHKTLSENCEKIRNVILFVDFIKFGPQTFDCYIYFVLNICFSILSLSI
jgi:hypothetical protein